MQPFHRYRKYRTLAQVYMLTYYNMIFQMFVTNELRVNSHNIYSWKKLKILKKKKPKYPP